MTKPGLDDEWTEADCDNYVIDGQGASHSDIAKVFGVSVKLIRDIETQALLKLRQNPEAVRLMALYLQHRSEHESE